MSFARLNFGLKMYKFINRRALNNHMTIFDVVYESLKYFDIGESFV